MERTDRRVAPRFEVLGGLWGSVEMLEPMRVHNIAPEGMLTESRTPMAVGTVLALRLLRGCDAVVIRAGVRHSTPADAVAGTGRYLVGLEFLDLDSQATKLVDELVNEPSAPADILEV